MKKFINSLTAVQKRIILIALAALLVVSGIATAVIWSLPQQTNTENATKKVDQRPDIQMKELTKDYYGVLVLGSDEGATKTNGGNHTDSVTYIAINKKTGKAYALPIYRDAYVKVACSDNSVNINQIYRDYGADCLKQSVADLLGLQVDYKIYITSNGYVDILNTLGPLEITPEASYCSKYGNDENEYCFVEGQTKMLNGNELLAYARFRGNTSGEARANRHVQILNQIYSVCFDKKQDCATAVLRLMATKDIQTDLPFNEVLEIQQQVFLESLGVIAGSNFQDDAGWHQRVNESDLATKRDKIKTEIFV